ncbi:MAG: GAF domain-containing protein [Candidatus Aquilonibacter sp.]|jgi:hypothetical protein
MKLVARLVLIAITALVIVIFYVPLGHADYAGVWGGGTFGVDSTRQFSVRVDAVAPGSPADVAGVRAGDTLEVTPFSKGFALLIYPRAGDRGTFTFRRPDGRAYTVTMTAVSLASFTRTVQLLGILAIIPATIFVAIAFVLVFLRPNVMTWSFYAFATGFLSTQPSMAFYQAYLSPVAFSALAFFLTTVWGNFAVLPLLPFVMRFPDDKLTGFTRTFDRGVWIAIAAAFIAYSVAWFKWEDDGYSFWSDALDVWIPLAAFVLATYIVIKKYKHASPQVRQRFGFLVPGLIVSFIAYAIYFVPAVPRWLSEIIGIAVVIMPISVMYAVLKHRVLDINFVLNRALAYGILSVFVIAFVSFLDWTAGHLLSEGRFATGVELLATIAIGFLLDRINHAVQNLVEVVFFRGRRRAEDYLRRVARALPYATEESAVTEGLVQEPVDALQLSAAALYRRSSDGKRFEGIATSRETTVAPPGFDGNHLLVRMLESGEQRVWLEELRGHLDREQAQHYVLAVPVTVRHELVSFVLYGPHRNGSQLDPEEVELLEELAREASRAYDHIEAVRVRERYAAINALPQPGTA